MEDFKPIGQLIREYRKKAEMTQAELAEKLGCSVANVSQYESGKRNPKAETIGKIVKALNAPIMPFLPSIQISERDGRIALPVAGGVFEGTIDAYIQYMQAASLRSFAIFVNDHDCYLDLKKRTISFDDKEYPLTPQQIAALPGLSIEMIKTMIKACSISAPSEE